ncbi:MAG: hypothetical protein ONB48_00295 [candidate division KSB1 bacterium]|nr:hypothetical protein [candidate division KSB1 bacterium]MDZ7272885.1 hypothetical protein [candidate division KSB1 bacterium]MDZ7284092.1 hypothetical protein [candidate division KSB1 bacterium]MDZ7297510.1 hypothetical protein [candidate division KSB1 bacterium]MDZ7308246.1 hypothetical protein [candidate division KSB1 bacterium]
MPRLPLFLLIAMPFLVFSCASHGSRTAAGAAAKLDPRLHSRLQEPAAANTAELAVLIKFQQPLTPAQQMQLQERGVKLIAHTGTVATATLPPAALLPLAELDFVRYVEPSKEYRLQQETVH